MRFSVASLLKSVSNYPVSKGDLPGHEFHGNQYTTLGNGEIRPVHETTGEPTMTSDNPLRMVSEGEITPAETQKYFGGREHHGYFIGRPDGNVNPLTGEISGGAKQSVGRQERSSRHCSGKPQQFWSWQYFHQSYPHWRWRNENRRHNQLRQKLLRPRQRLWRSYRYRRPQYGSCLRVCSKPPLVLLGTSLIQTSV